MKTRSLLYGLVATFLCALSPLAHADYIACPAETTWKVTTPLPDPWSSTVQTSGASKQFTVLINSVEWLVCQYSHAPGESSVYTKSGWGFRVGLQRPPFKDQAVPSIAMCPANSIATEATSPVPAPWKSTKYIWTLEGVSVRDIGGVSHIVCNYVAPYDSQGVGPSSLLQPLNLGDEKPLAAKPKPGPVLPGNLAAEFAVTNVRLATVPAPRQRACPTQVGFQGSIEVNGPGEVIYRIVDNKGIAGPQQKLGFSKAGAVPLAFQINVDAPTSPPAAHSGSFAAPTTPSGPRKATTNGSGPAATSNVTAANAPGLLWGFQRIEILAPAGGKTKSQDAAWSVQCATVNNPSAVTNIQAQPKRPSPALRLPKTPPPSKPLDTQLHKDTDKK